MDEEKKKTEKAYHDFLPPSIVKDIKMKKQTAERFDCVTIFFGDIVGFNSLTSDCSALEVKFAVHIHDQKFNNVN